MGCTLFEKDRHQGEQLVLIYNRESRTENNRKRYQSRHRADNKGKCLTRCYAESEIYNCDTGAWQLHATSFALPVPVHQNDTAM